MIVSNIMIIRAYFLLKFSVPPQTFYTLLYILLRKITLAPPNLKISKIVIITIVIYMVRKKLYSQNNIYYITQIILKLQYSLLSFYYIVL